MNRLILVLGLIATQSVSAITVSESKVLKHARAELLAAESERDQSEGDLTQAEKETDDANWWALDAEQRAADAQKQADAEHKALVDATTLLNEWKPVMDTINRWWGIGAIIYGFKRLAVHLLILSAVLIVGGLVLAYFFPPVLKLFGFIWRRIMSAGSALIAKVESRIESHEETEKTSSPPAKSIRHSTRR